MVKLINNILLSFRKRNAMYKNSNIVTDSCYSPLRKSNVNTLTDKVKKKYVFEKILDHIPSRIDLFNFKLNPNYIKFFNISFNEEFSSQLSNVSAKSNIMNMCYIFNNTRLRNISTLYNGISFGFSWSIIPIWGLTFMRYYDDFFFWFKFYIQTTSNDINYNFSKYKFNMQTGGLFYDKNNILYNKVSSLRYRNFLSRRYFNTVRYLLDSSEKMSKKWFCVYKYRYNAIYQYHSNCIYNEYSFLLYELYSKLFKNKK